MTAENKNLHIKFNLTGSFYLIVFFLLSNIPSLEKLSDVHGLNGAVPVFRQDKECLT